jgi:hypothetical protein
MRYLLFTLAPRPIGSLVSGCIVTSRCEVCHD